MPADAIASTLEPFFTPAFAALSARHGEWAGSARQDAVESMRRLSRWHLVRRGCRVPLYELYFVGMRRAVDQASRRFIEQAAPVAAERLGRAEAELVLQGKGCVLPLELARGQVDLVIVQGLMEAPIDYIRRFEAEVVEQLEALYSEQLQPHLRGNLDRVGAAWAGQGEG